MTVASKLGTFRPMWRALRGRYRFLRRRPGRGPVVPSRRLVMRSTSERCASSCSVLNGSCGQCLPRSGVAAMKKAVAPPMVLAR